MPGNVPLRSLAFDLAVLEIDGKRDVRYAPVRKRRPAGEVRNVLAYLGLQVSRLIRVSYGPFTVEGMETGDLGEVPPHIIAHFRKTLA